MLKITVALSLLASLAALSLEIESRVNPREHPGKIVLTENGTTTTITPRRIRVEGPQGKVDIDATSITLLDENDYPIGLLQNIPAGKTWRRCVSLLLNDGAGQHIPLSNCPTFKSPQQSDPEHAPPE